MGSKGKTKFQQTEVGMIPEDWEVKKIGELVNINEHSINKEFKCSEIEYVDIDSVDRGIIKNRQILRLADAPSRAKRIVKDQDVIVSTVRPNLKHFAFIQRAKPNTIVSTGFAVISSKKVNSRFLYYYLTTDKYTNFLSAIADAHTSTYPSFNPDVIQNSLIPYPSETEQKSIAKILSGFDSKVELNQRMIRSLEAVGQAVFKRWFVDFEFPNEEGKPYKSSGGEMIYSKELGKEIPKRWLVRKLDAFIDLDKGLSYKGAFLSNQGLPMINLGTIASKAGFIPEGIKHYTGEYKEKQLVKARDIVIANTDITQKREVLGSPAIVPPNLGCEKALFTHHIFAVRKKATLPNLFIYYLLQLKEYRNRVVGFATGTTVLALPKDAVLDFEFAVPDNQTLGFFEEIAVSLMKKTDANSMQNKNLVQIRDTLLPKLMSGKIRVPIPKENVEAQ